MYFFKATHSFIHLFFIKKKYLLLRSCKNVYKKGRMYLLLHVHVELCRPMGVTVRRVFLYYLKVIKYLLEGVSWLNLFVCLTDQIKQLILLCNDWLTVCLFVKSWVLRTNRISAGWSLFFIPEKKIEWMKQVKWQKSNCLC